MSSFGGNINEQLLVNIFTDFNCYLVDDFISDSSLGKEKYKQLLFVVYLKLPGVEL